MMNDALAQQLKHLRLHGLLERWDEHLKAAAQGNFSHARLLTRVIEEEYRLKCEQARQQRLKLAKIPEQRVMDTFPFVRLSLPPTWASANGLRASKILI